MARGTLLFLLSLGVAGALSACGGGVQPARDRATTNPVGVDPGTSRYLNQTPTTFDSNRGAPL